MHVTCESFSRALSLLQGHGIEIRNETVTIVDPIRLAKHGKPDPLIDGPEGEYPSLGDHGSTGQIRLRPVLALPRPAETGQGWPLSCGVIGTIMTRRGRADRRIWRRVAVQPFRQVVSRRGGSHVRHRINLRLARRSLPPSVSAGKAASRPPLCGAAGTGRTNGRGFASWKRSLDAARSDQPQKEGRDRASSASTHPAGRRGGGARGGTPRLQKMTTATGGP
jgi:hypothetical protein